MEISIKWAVCRVCLKEENTDGWQMMNIFGEKEGKKWANQIFACSGVAIQSNDGLPQKICKTCMFLLRQAMRFRLTCQKSNQCLQNVLKKTKFTTELLKPNLLEADEEEDDDSRVVDNMILKENEDAYSTAHNNDVYMIGLSGDKNDSDGNIIVERKSTNYAQEATTTTTTSGEIIKTDMEDNFLITTYEENLEKDKPPENQVDFDDGSDIDDMSIESERKSLNCTINNEQQHQQHINHDSNSSYLMCKEDNYDNDFSVAKTYLKSTMVDNDDIEEISFCIFNESSLRMQDQKGCKDETEDNSIILNDLPDIDLKESINRNSIDSILFGNEENNSRNLLKQRKNQMRLIKDRYRQKPAVYVNCEICGNQFSSKSILKSHMRIHLQEKQFECEICGKKFSASCNLTAHMRVHTGEKPYKCDYCGRCFSDKSTLIKHERTHTNERPYACDVCDKRFSLTTSLKAHERVHTGEKPYSCSLCCKSFKLPHQLKAHQNTLAHKTVVNVEMGSYDN